MWWILREKRDNHHQYNNIHFYCGYICRDKFHATTYFRQHSHISEAILHIHKWDTAVPSSAANQRGSATTYSVDQKPGIRDQNAESLSRRTYKTEEESTAIALDLDDEEVIAEVQVLAEETSLVAAVKIQNLEIHAQPTKPAIVTVEYSQEPVTSVGCRDINNDEIIHPSFTPKIEEENIYTLPLLQWQHKNLQPIL